MADKLISPGVYTTERDSTFRINGASVVGAAIVGPFKKGISFIPTVIESQAELEDMFGIPDGTYYAPYTAQDYLREAGVVTICRVNGLGGYEQTNPIIIKATPSGSTTQVVAVLANSKEGGSALTGWPSAVLDANATSSYVTSADFSLKLDGTTNTSASINPASADYITNVFGGSAQGSNEAYAYKLFETTLESIKSANGYVVMTVETASAAMNFTDDTTWATTPWIQSQLINSTRYNLFRFHTIPDGNASNTQVKVSIENVKAAGTLTGTDYGSFNVVVRAFDDTDKRTEVLETYANLTLDPDDANYVARVIGDAYTTIDSAGKLTKNGDWDNASKYIRVEMSSGYPESVIPVANAPYSVPVASATQTEIPTVTYRSSLGTDETHYGFYSSIVDNTQYCAPIPSGSGTGSNTTFSLDSTVGLDITGSTSTLIDARKFTVAFQGGFDGMAPNIPINLGSDISTTNSQGFDLSASTSSGSVAYKRIFDALSNTDEFDINLLVTPGVIRRLHSAVTTDAIDLVEDRTDAFYIADLTAAGDSISQATTQATSVDTNYAATYYPWVKIVDSNTNKKVSVPPSVLMAGVYAANDRISAEWYAPAGLGRGGLIQATDVLNILTQADRDTLYESKVNPIAKFPGQGISAWGQKTLQQNASALDRVNVRRLLITVKRYISSISKNLVFEQNTAQTRARFLNIVNPYLESIQQRQGLFAFRVVMDESNNTPDIIDRNILKGDIYLQPTRTAEFIQLNFNVQPTGATFG